MQSINFMQFYHYFTITDQCMNKLLKKYDKEIKYPFIISFYRHYFAVCITAEGTSSADKQAVPQAEPEGNLLPLSS